MKTKDLKYVTVTIEQDESAGNPRDEFDNMSTFYAVRNSRYISGGKNDITFTYRDYLESAMREFKQSGAVIVPFTSDAGDCYAVIERAKIRKEYGNDSRSALYHARQCAKGEIETYLNWANGEIYGFVIKNNETGETLDSCWGFYGREYCEQEAQAMAEDLERELQEQQNLITTRLEQVSA